MANSTLTVAQMEQSLVRTNDVKRIAIIGDSLSAQSPIFADVYPTKLQTLLNQNGVNCEVKSFAVNGFTYFDINSVAVFGTNSCLLEAIAYTPDVMIVCAGHNDTIALTSARTIAQVQADATATFDFIRSQLPSSEIYYASQLPYDKANFTPATLLNKGTFPKYFTKKTTGILTGLFTPTILNDALDTPRRDAYADWETLDTTIRGLASVTGTFDLNIWKIARLGFLTVDGHHQTRDGNELLAASMVQGLVGLSAPFIANYADQLLPDWKNIDTLFSTLLTASGTDYIPAVITDTLEIAGLSSIADKVRLTTWWLPYGMLFDFSPLTVKDQSDYTSMFGWTVRNGPPNEEVEVSVNGGTFNQATHRDGVNIFTDETGYASSNNATGLIPLPANSYDFIFKIGDVATNTFVLTVTA